MTMLRVSQNTDSPEFKTSSPQKPKKYILHTFLPLKRQIYL